MAGPVFNILMRSPLTAAQLSELDVWLKTFTANMETHVNTAGEFDEWYFRVTDPGALGLPDRDNSCMIGLARVEPAREWEGDLEEQVMIRLGFWPRHGFNVYAMCKNFSTGRVTSYLILRLMERYEGYLDFCMATRVAENPPLSAEERQYEQRVPGNRFTIRYWAPDGRPFCPPCWWEKDIIDAEYLRWWLKDDRSVLPGFYTVNAP